MGLGSGIRKKNLFRIPDPGVKKAPDPGSGSATLHLIGLPLGKQVSSGSILCLSITIHFSLFCVFWLVALVCSAQCAHSVAPVPLAFLDCHLVVRDLSGNSLAFVDL
jgi:hypothetical protein